MILFWLICAALVLIALAFILPTALQRSEEAQFESEDERKKANIAVYRDQLSELKADVRNGIVSEEQYAQDREEIERRLLEDALSRNRFNQRATAVALGLSYDQLRHALKRHKLQDSSA